MQKMQKETYFASEAREGWPEPSELEPYFLRPPGQRWFFETRNDGASLKAESIDSSESIRPEEERGVILYMWGNDKHGVLLIYQKWHDDSVESFASKGDMRRVAEHIRTLHEDRMPIGLYIPFEEAWKAVKDFIETDGGRSPRIDWIATSDLPEGTFPDP